MRDIYILLVASLVLSIIAYVSWSLLVRKAPPPGALRSGGSKCASVHACGAIDPVSDPDYNMREVVKQSILLEEHLVEKNKRCKDCIAKHFLHIIGLSEEAQCLAGSKLRTFPLMDTNPSFYDALFKKWLSAKDDDANLRTIQDELRVRRKALMEAYFLADDKK